MKHKLFSILVFITAFICACGNNGSAKTNTDVETTEEATVEDNKILENWSIASAKDEFGDVVSGNDSIATNVDGTFSNSATSDSELLVYINVKKDNPQKHYNVAFRLFEYGNNQIQISDGALITLKTKLDNGKVREYYNEEAEEENDPFDRNKKKFPDLLYSKDSFSIFEEKADEFVKDLETNEIIKCVVYIDNSKYSFQVESGNFSELRKNFNVSGYVSPIKEAKTDNDSAAVSEIDAKSIITINSKGNDNFTKNYDVPKDAEAGDRRIKLKSTAKTDYAVVKITDKEKIIEEFILVNDFSIVSKEAKGYSNVYKSKAVSLIDGYTITIERGTSDIKIE